LYPSIETRIGRPRALESALRPLRLLGIIHISSNVSIGIPLVCFIGGCITLLCRDLSRYRTRRYALREPLTKRPRSQSSLVRQHGQKGERREGVSRILTHPVIVRKHPQTGPNRATRKMLGQAASGTYKSSLASGVRASVLSSHGNPASCIEQRLLIYGRAES